MIDKQTQDQAWAALSAAQRKKCRECYRRFAPQSAGAILTEIFGSHNLTSDAEPEEMIMCARKDVIGFYQEALSLIDKGHRNNYLNDRLIGIGQKNVLYTLFGSKCLSNESMQLSDVKEKIDEYFDAHTEEEVYSDLKKYGAIIEVDDSKAEPKKDRCEKCGAPNSSICAHLNCQDYKSETVRKAEDIADKCVEPVKEHFDKAKPRFKVGDKVKNHLSGKIDVVMGKTGRNSYVLYDCGYNVHEDYLEPYTEPRFKIGDKVIHNHKNKEVGEVVEYFPNEKFCYSVRFGEEFHCMAEEQLLPYTEPTQTNDNMEEKKLNLCEMLKGHEGETFYLYLRDMFVTLEKVTKDEIWLLYANCDRTILNSHGGYKEFLGLQLFPSDDQRNWQEWIEEQKPKRWKPAKGEKYWHINEFMNVSSSFYDDEIFDSYTKVEETNNCFQSFELAQQAAEAVKKCLEDFHSKLNQQ